jgi:pectate lyase
MAPSPVETRTRVRDLLLVVVVVLIAAGRPAAQRDIGREVLAADDGFASIGDGTTGGASADAAHVFIVRNRAELVAALNAGPVGAARIVYVDGVIDANVDDNNRPLACEDYYRDGYTRDAFLAFYNPAGP